MSLLPTKICMSKVKAVVFPVVMYGCESWTIKKTECQRIDAFELWCWKRLLRVPWTARSSNQSILKEISPKYSLEGQMLKLKLQFFGYLMQRTDSLEKTLMLGKIEGRRRRRQQRWLDGITDWWTWVWASSGSWWRTGKPGILQSMGCKEVARAGWSHWTELNWYFLSGFCATVGRRAFSGSCLHSGQEGCRKACLRTPIRCLKSLLLCRPQAERETALHEDTFRLGLFYSTSFTELQLRSGTRETRQTISLKRFKSHWGRKDTLANNVNLQWVKREGSTWEAQEDIGLMRKRRQGSWCLMLDLLTFKSLTKVQVSIVLWPMTRLVHFKIKKAW